MLKSIRMHNWKNNHGFTLVELLVVISIIALLLAVLMPALSAARKTAQRVVCSTNIKGLGDGTLLFAADHDDWLPIEDGKTLGSLKAQYGCADCLALGSRFPQRNYWFVDIAPYVGLEKDPYIQHTGGMKNSWLTAEQAGINAPSLLVCHSKKKSIYGVHPLAYGWNWYGLGESCKSYFSPSPSRILNYWGPWKIVQIRSPYITGIIGENAL
jgi:prepilin-type N-terminal cleavage/methylation domain-containing protein